jgi:hypothetical protein
MSRASRRAPSVTVISPLASMASMYRWSLPKLRGRRPAGMPNGPSMALASAQ